MLGTPLSVYNRPSVITSLKFINTNNISGLECHESKTRSPKTAVFRVSESTYDSRATHMLSSSLILRKNDATFSRFEQV